MALKQLQVILLIEKIILCLTQTIKRNGNNYL